MVNFDYKLLYFAETKEYTQYGIELAKPFELEHDDLYVYEVVVQYFPATKKVFLNVGNTEEYCVHEDLAEVYGHSPEEILDDICHLAVWLNKESVEQLDATIYYMEWLEDFNAECNEEMNIRDYLWLHHELDKSLIESVPYVEGAYYTKTGELYTALCYSPAPTIKELIEQGEFYEGVEV